MLTLLIIIPILGSISLVCLNEKRQGYDLQVRQWGLAWSIIVWLLSTLIWIGFDCNEVGWQYVNNWGGIAGLGSIRIGIDGLGLTFVMLTTYLIPISILSTWDTVDHNIRSHIISILILEALLIVVFVSADIIAFYVSFESVLIPLYLLVGTHGATSARLRASMLLFMYTLGGSLFMLLGLIRLLEIAGTSDITALSIMVINPEAQRWIWLGLFVSLAVKCPLVPAHIWLPRAHAEASLAGSILLAGIVLKLSVYGYLRLLIPILPDASIYFRPLVLTLGVISLIHGSLVTLRQVDTKAFVAMASVSHMGCVMLGLASGTIHGIQGAILLSVAHGLVSPALFILVGGVIYSRYHTRTIRYIRGLGSSMPSFKTWFWLASCASMAVPGSLNWVSEILCLTGTYEISPFAGILGASSVLLGAIYTVWLYVSITGGSPSPYLALTNDMTLRERTLLLMLIIPTFILGIYPNFVMDTIHIFVTGLVNTPISICSFVLFFLKIKKEDT